MPTALNFGRNKQTNHKHKLFQHIYNKYIFQCHSSFAPDHYFRREWNCHFRNTQLFPSYSLYRDTFSLYRAAFCHQYSSRSLNNYDSPLNIYEAMRSEPNRQELWRDADVRRLAEAFLAGSRWWYRAVWEDGIESMALVLSIQAAFDWNTFGQRFGFLFMRRRQRQHWHGNWHHSETLLSVSMGGDVYMTHSEAWKGRPTNRAACIAWKILAKWLLHKPTTHHNSLVYIPETWFSVAVLTNA